MDALTVALPDWAGFFAAEVGAAAALGGLIFVGLSINLNGILATPNLANRAFLALALLMVVLLVAGRMLIPGDATPRLGIEVTVLGMLLLVGANTVEVVAWRRLTVENRITFVFNLVLLEFATVPYVMGGILLVLDDPVGLHLVAAGMTLSFVKAVIDAWVLLVEINR